MINQLTLTNFTAFSSSLDIKFSPKINIIIGENSTGKTQLLKAAYGLCSGGSPHAEVPNIDKEDFETAVTEKMIRLFMPLDGKLGKMHHYGATDNAQLEATFSQDKTVQLTFHNNSKVLAAQPKTNYIQTQADPVFIPTKEVLSFMKGFVSLYDKYGLSFDLTYKDICLLLDLPEMRSDVLHEKSKWAMDEIKSICGGRFKFYGGGNVTFKTENSEFSANSMAEGFRKAGMLSRLLETGAIQPGVSGPLFWDEPETNMNPKLMKLLVKIMLELSRNGQQIIIATHDYVLLKWFDLLMNSKEGDHVRFHMLYRDKTSNDIKINSVDKYQLISPNAIADTFNDLTKEQVRLKMGTLGK